MTGVCPLSSGFHLGLSGLPQLSGLRMDSSPPSRQEGFISRHGHSDASAEVTEEKLPNGPHCQLRGSVSSEKVKASRCFLHPAAQAPEESLSFHFQREGKTPRASCLCRGSTKTLASHPEPLRRDKKEEGGGLGGFHREEEQRRKQDLKEA